MPRRYFLNKKFVNATSTTPSGMPNPIPTLAEEDRPERLISLAVAVDVELEEPTAPAPIEKLVALGTAVIEESGTTSEVVTDPVLDAMSGLSPAELEMLHSVNDEDLAVQHLIMKYLPCCKSTGRSTFRNRSSSRQGTKARCGTCRCHRFAEAVTKFEDFVGTVCWTALYSAVVNTIFEVWIAAQS